MHDEDILIKLRFWNINGRWTSVDKKFINDKDIVFLSETHNNVKSLECVPGFTAFGDPDFPYFQKHGGIVVYIKNFFAQYITNLRYTKFTISFTLSVVKKVFFMGVYIYPPTSPNYKDTDYAEVINEINYWLCKGFHPYVGGDFNSRIGNINMISLKSLNWRYAENSDTVINLNMIHFSNMCEVLKILPLNHCKYSHKEFDGGYTYFKADKKSQIDYVMTNNAGRKNVTDFKLITYGWHFSDHLPVDLTVRIKYHIDPLAIYIRSKALVTSNENTKGKFTLKLNRKLFDINVAKAILVENAETLTKKCYAYQSAEPIINDMHTLLDRTITQASYAKYRHDDKGNDDIMNECDELFEKYLTQLNKTPCDQDRIRNLYNTYQNKRNELTHKWLTSIHQKYKNIVENKNSKELWRAVDWSGEINKPVPLHHPSIEELSEHFTTLYEPIENDGDLALLNSNVYIPETDDPITQNEIREASSQMKKGGYDFPLTILKLLIVTVAGVVLLLMNTILYDKFPLNLCTSLLAAIPKSGNLRLTNNYRGIQMQPLLANLYDRILSNRLMRWVKINNEQTAFQKGKSTIDQIFILRIIISLIKANNLTLYIGFFDLSKAFDRVSRYLLLKQLLKLGIGSVIFNSLKSIYSVTRCVLKGFGKLSEVFETYTGIKQGASSSVILFIVFLDDIIDDLKQNCLVEPILNDLHCLLHADDTMLLSTSREQFIHKCNILLKLISDKKMKLNYTKSGYMIINGKANDLKCDLKLASQWLQYKSSQKYLGTVFTDTGILKTDISSFIDKKNKEINVKLASFLVKNQFAPINMKMKVVNACVDSALTYGCEAWSSFPLNKVEVLQRKAIKMVMGVYSNSANEIIYVESGVVSLKPIIYKRQLKYFRIIKQECMNDPTSNISKNFQHAINSKTPFIRHYIKLDEKFPNINQCYDYYVNEHKEAIRVKIMQKNSINPDSILGTYLKVNPQLEPPKLYKDLNCHETDRMIISRYRVGSHRLNIQAGRLRNVKMEERMCKCSTSIQTLEHVLFDCTLTEIIRHTHIVQTHDLQSFFNHNDYVKISSTLKAIEKVLRIR